MLREVWPKFVTYNIYSFTLFLLHDVPSCYMRRSIEGHSGISVYRTSMFPKGYVRLDRVAFQLYHDVTIIKLLQKLTQLQHFQTHGGKK